MIPDTNDTPVQETKNNEKELNFRRLEAKYQHELQLEREKRQEIEKKIEDMSRKSLVEDDDDAEPYIDHKKLEKKLARFGETTKQQTQSEIHKAVQHAIKEERKDNWIRGNPDFYEVLKHAEKLAIKDPELAEAILEMPESFERQKLVYKNIKALGLDKPELKPPSMQEKIESNKRSPYYQPSGIASSPYSSAGDFSPSGQKNSYDKMKELQARLRL